MNYSTAIFLINDTARAILGIYETGDNAPRTMFKTLDPEIEVGDFVIVQSGTRHGMTVVKVVETDVEPDFDNLAEIKWVIGTIDLEDFKDLEKQEKDAIAAIRLAEKRKKRNDLREALFASQAETLKGLEIAHMPDNATTLEPPASE